MTYMLQDDIPNFSYYSDQRNIQNMYKVINKITFQNELYENLVLNEPDLHSGQGSLNKTNTLFISKRIALLTKPNAL